MALSVLVLFLSKRMWCFGIFAFDCWWCFAACGTRQRLLAGKRADDSAAALSDDFLASFEEGFMALSAPYIKVR